MDRRAWWTRLNSLGLNSPWGCKESDTTKWLTPSLSFSGEGLPGPPPPTQSRVHAEQPLLCRHTIPRAGAESPNCLPSSPGACSVSPFPSCSTSPSSASLAHVLSPEQKLGVRLPGKASLDLPSSLPPWRGAKEEAAVLGSFFISIVYDAVGLPLVGSGVFLWN